MLITGACRGVGHSCAEAMAARGTELILCDNDAESLAQVAEALEAADHFHCDVASDRSVTAFAAEVAARFAWLDVVINAAGGGYERTLGMYRASRALLPLLRHGHDRLLVNVPPSAMEADAPIFPYASSGLAFQRLSAALALEVKGMSITVLTACPAKRKLLQVLPDPNAGNWADNCELSRATREDVRTLAWQVASLVGRRAPVRHAG